MVGVAGKSNACKTCKKRKIRCEGEKPTCRRCKKGGRVCEGYERTRQFKHLSALDHDALLARSQPLTSLTELSYMFYDHFPASEQDDNLARYDVLRPKEKDPQNASLPQASDSFPNSLDDYLPEEVREKDNYETPASWIQATSPLRRRHSLLDLTRSALTMLRLGRNCGNERLQREGMAKYGRALKDLQDILASDSLALEEQNLASCMTLTIFEVLEPSGGNICGWASHVQGISRLFQLRGPERHVTELSHHLFLGFRPTAIIHALAVRKPTYLSQPEWLTIPWTTQSKNDFHHMLDILAQIPILVDQTQRVDNLSQSNTSDAKRSELLEQGWELHSQLKDWYQELGRSAPEPFYIERPSSLSWPSLVPSDLEDVFPTSFHFQSFQIARMHLFYWTALLLVYINILRTMPLSLEADQLDFTTSSSLSSTVQQPTTDKAAIQRQALDIATLIARSMDFLLSEESFLLSEEMHIRGLLNTVFPLRTAIHVFSIVHQHRMESWSRSVFDGLAQRGYRFGQILCGWEWDDIPVFLSGR